MLRFLNLPILFPVLMGLGLLILHPESRKTRNLYLMTAVLITSALSSPTFLRILSMPLSNR